MVNGFRLKVTFQLLQNGTEETCQQTKQSPKKNLENKNKQKGNKFSNVQKKLFHWDRSNKKR